MSTLSTLIRFNLVVWLTSFNWFIPSAVDKQASNDDVVIIEHKLDNEG